MAYRPPQKTAFSTNYTPRYKAKDFKSKKIPAPEQPAGLSISSFKIGEYVRKRVETNDFAGYKRLFDQIKILVKSVMHVLCETQLTIDRGLWERVNKTKCEIETKHDTVITFPVKKYEYEKWVVIFRALIPSVPFPFNLTGSQSTSDGCIEKWYEIAVYIYQNLLLTSSSKKREEIDNVFKEDNAKARNRSDRNKAYDTRNGAIDQLKKNIYGWVNRMGHIVKEYEYIRLNDYPEKIQDINDWIDYSDLMLVNGVLNGSFIGTNLVSEKYESFLDSHVARQKEEYDEMIRFYRSKECTSTKPDKERMLYDTIANLARLYRDYHYDRASNYLLHEFDILTTVMEYLDGDTPTQEKQIRILINRLTDKNFATVCAELKTFNPDMVRSSLSRNVQGEPQQEYIVRLMAQFDMSDIVITKLREHKAKRFESYHNTVAWSILHGVIPFDVINDETIFLPTVTIDILISLLNSTKLNPLLIKNNMERIKEITDELLPTTTSYSKFRLKDAFIEANNVLINH